MGNKAAGQSSKGSVAESSSSASNNLVAAAKRGDMATVQKLLTSGTCDIDERDVNIYLCN